MSDKISLTDIRKKIDGIDQELVKLVNARAKLGIMAGKAKKSAVKFRPSREAEVIAKVKAANQGPITDQTLEAVMREVISGCLNLEQPMRISYLGPQGTYSEDAARRRFGEMAQYLPCDSLEEVLSSLEKGNVDVAVLPIENSTEGSVGKTLDMLCETNMQICDEIYLPIHHQLLSVESSLDDIKQIFGHPQALAQCGTWLSRNLPRAEQTPVSSNGQAAKLAAGKESSAALASKRAAEVYGLQVLSVNVEDKPDNTTRFVVLGPQSADSNGNDKTSLICATRNQPGALLALLQVFDEHQINMVKLESRPANTGTWEYVFYIDIEGHHNDPTVASALAKLDSKSTFIKIIGSYPKAV